MSTTYILEDLQPDSSYEVYVQARNFYGTGVPTTRIVFRTASKTVVDLAKTGKLKNTQAKGTFVRPKYHFPHEILTRLVITENAFSYVFSNN